MKLIFILFLMSTCATHEPQKIKYSRQEWRHWSDVDQDCQNTRHEILIARSETSVSMDRKGCRVMKGTWNDYYYPEIHSLSREVDIDHLIPLKHAHEAGGALWSSKKKETFANDPENLVVTNLRYNRQKGAKRIDQWLPVHKAYACKYIKDWLRLKSKYGLRVFESEKATIELSDCTT